MSPRLRTLALAALTTTLLAAAVAPAAVARGKDCPALRATAAAAKSCDGCRPVLKATAFGDQFPTAGSVGTTAGLESVIVARINRSCSLPSNARMVVIRQPIDALGNNVGPSTRLECGRSSCRIPQTRQSAGGYRYQVAIVGCKGAKRSRVVTIVWADKPTPVGGGGSGGSGGSGGNPPANAITPKLRRVLYDGQPNGDPFCTAPLPGGAGQGTATYNNGTSNVRWEWSAPGEITAGATASISVTTNTTLNGGWSGGIGISSPFEFGISPATPSTEAIVPVGKPGSDGPKQVSYTFTPNRAFNAGETLYLAFSFQCARILYEYVAS
jgi:hypothetical protein